MNTIAIILNGILYPFTLIISTFFRLSYAISGNYGIALVFLSFFITVITTPLYYLAEKWKNSERFIQKKIHKDIQSINAHFEGQKKFYLIKTARKIYGYKWWYTFRTSFGLLIQIPFFFAAYEVLAHYTEFKGVSFLFIKDLSMPDAIMGGVNILPFIMTAVNIMYSVYYTKSKSLQANKELYTVAILFLVLLYTSPAALLVYWTMNNVFSFIKGIILRRQGLLPVPVLLIEEKTKSFKQILKENINIILFFFFTLICSLQVYNIINHPQTFKYIILLCVIAVLTVSCISVFYLDIDKRKLLRIFILWLFYAPVLYLVFFYRTHNPFISNVNIKLLCGFYSSFIIYKLICNMLPPPPSTHDVLLKHDSFKINIKFIFVLVFWIFIYLPIMYYTVDPGLVNITFKLYLAYIIKAALIAMALLSFIYYILNSKNRVKYNFNLFFLLLLMSVYSLFLKLDTGQLDYFTFQKEKNIYTLSFLVYAFDAIIITSVLALARYLFIRKIRTLQSFIVIIPILLTAVLIHRVKTMDVSQIHTGNEGLAPHLYENHKLSKTGTNVIYVLADMFNGNYLGRIIEEEPEYKTKLDGFTWYPDCLSASNETIRSMPALLGGESEIYKALAYKDDIVEQDYKDAIERTGNNFFSKLKEAEYNITISYDSDLMFADLSGINREHFRDFTNYWRLKHGLKEEKTANQFIKLYMMLALFQSVPYHLKPILYDNSSWLIFLKENKFITQTQLGIKSVAQLDILPDISSVTDLQQNNFFFLHSLLPHAPYAIGKNGEIFTQEHIKEIEYKNINNKDLAYYSAKKTISLLIKYIDWLKENNVYDNTIIYIFSDHGNPFKDNDISIPKNITYTDAADNIAWANTLMLIKPKNTNGVLKKDPLYISSADLPAMLSNDINVNIIEGRDPRISEQEENKKRIRLFFAPAFKEKKKNLYYLRGSIFDEKAWSMNAP